MKCSLESSDGLQITADIKTPTDKEMHSSNKKNGVSSQLE